MDRPSARNPRHGPRNQRGAEINPPPRSFGSPSSLPLPTIYGERTNRATDRTAADTDASRQHFTFSPASAQPKPFLPRSSFSQPTPSDRHYHQYAAGQQSGPSSPEQSRYPRDASGQRATPPYSFNVLRCDPSTSSLEDINSANLRAHEGVIVRRSPPPGAPKGSSPSFRVNISPPSPTGPKFPVGDQYQRNRDSELEASVIGPTRSFAGLSSTSVLSFSVSGPSSSRAPVTFVGHTRDMDDGTVYSDDGGETDQNWKVKRHQCPHCTKRFNRPSSLRIHVNTHTGARPFQCPHPNCGREFNVNSNMRRHYRNHVRPGPSHLRRSPSPSHTRSGKRRVGPVLPRTALGQTAAYMASSPAPSTTELSGDEIYDVDGATEGRSDDDEEDQLADDGEDARHDGEPPAVGYQSPGSAASASPSPSASSALRTRSGYRYPQGHEGPLNMRSHDSALHPQSPSPSLSPRANSPCKYTHSSSIYRASGDKSVSTVLRPAFPIQPSKSSQVKDEVSW